MPTFGQRQFSMARLLPLLSSGRFIENPDEVLRQFGSYEGIKYYFRMLRQFPFLSGPINQRIDRVMAVERVIMPGDANDDDSVLMAVKARIWWASIKNKAIILRRLLLGMFVGFAAIEKVFGYHEATDLIAPVSLFDVPQQNVKFDAEGRPVIVTPRKPSGEAIDPRKLLLFIWGTLSSPYGEAELKNVYLATWYMQSIIDAGVEALETLGRPVLTLFVPRAADTKEVDSVEQAIAENFPLFMTLPTDDSEYRTDVGGGGANAIAGGNLGRSENEWLRYFETWIWTCLINTAQTQDRGGAGNGKLEQQRELMKDDKTAYSSDALDETLNELLSDLGELNWANHNRALWPMFRSDTAEVSQAGLNGIQIQTFITILLRLTALQITKEAAEEAIAALGVPRARAARVVQATIDQRGTLQVSPEMVKAAAQPIVNSDPSDEEEREAA